MTAASDRRKTRTVAVRDRSLEGRVQQLDSSAVQLSAERRDSRASRFRFVQMTVYRRDKPVDHALRDARWCWRLPHAAKLAPPLCGVHAPRGSVLRWVRVWVRAA